MIESRHLTGKGSALRGAILLVMALAAAALRCLEPQTLSILPLRASCGALTGLPCIFCGSTRALHHLLNGRLAEALHFNWLAFPVALLAVVLVVKLFLEILSHRRLDLRVPVVRVTPRTAVVAASLLFGLWLLQVSLALSGHKAELLNGHAPLYRLVIGESADLVRSR